MQINFYFILSSLRSVFLIITSYERLFNTCVVVLLKCKDLCHCFFEVKGKLLVILPLSQRKLH